MSINWHVKDKLIKCCDELLEVITNNAVEYGSDLSERVVAAKRRIDEYVFRIYIVGPFSCGKSSMLNRWLGQRLLVTGTDPTTAVSTELRYGEEEKVELYSMTNPNEIESTLSGPVKKSLSLVHDRANNEELANVIVYLNNPQLKKYADLSIVDMPGLSSANRTHEVAINRFLQEANPVGVFCIAATDGTPHATCLDFIKRMKTYHGEFKLLLMQADKQTQTELEETVKCCSKVIGELIGETVECGSVSLDSVDDLNRMLDAFAADKDGYLLDYGRSELSYLIQDIERPLRRALSKKFDRSAMEKALAQIEDAKQAIPGMVDEIKRDLDVSLGTATNDVMEKVRVAANGQRKSCIQGGPGAAEALRGAIENAISYAVPRAVDRAVSASNRQADRFFGDKLGGADDCGDVIETDSGNDTAVVPQKEEGNSLNKTFGQVFSSLNGEIQLSPMSLGMGVAGEMLLGSLGLGPLGFAAGIAASFFINYKANEEKRREREAECDRAIQSSIENVRQSVEVSLEKAKVQYLEKLQDIAERRVSILEEQMLQLKNESDANEAEWTARQNARQQDLDKVMAVYRMLEEV